MSVKGLPLAYNKDLQETQQPVFAAAGQVTNMLRVATGFMGAVEFDYKRMQRAATRGFMNAMAAAAYLVRQDVPFRRAHELVGKAVRLCLEKSCELEQLSPGDFAALRHQGRCSSSMKRSRWPTCWRSTTLKAALLPRACGRPCTQPKKNYPCTQELPMRARNAKLPDALAIEQLIQVHVGDGTLLPRSLRGHLREHPRLHRGRE